ncbi:E3 ubiquitin-protein ligase DCST1 [Carassius auratus]|uniref:E3 ubiquitin-protein ligase DCST1 n=1 Tax=Carassius auratus TaxID=7957 RepID=A0A6P6R614_CARAU|nr:E3 ubiquitin-protein ligase DCST1 [Carassius auratus]XP_026140641.1 E3 ubiquitin-protein ligase DCST1 [Carassius auratus]XP_026140643.1 E3 ubiquitin-protein ligase DCST1 [Carassius auratus]
MECLRETQTKLPHSTLEKVCKRILPPGVYKILFGPLSEFPVVRRLTGAVFGALSGVGLYFGLMLNIAMTTVQRVIVGSVFVGLCSLGGMFSSLFRCSILLMFPSIIGSQGRTVLMVYVLHGLYQGPIANIQRNVQDVASSMGCNIDLQITHSKLMWRMLTEPYVQVVQEIVNDSDVFQKEAQDVSRQFQKIRDEVMGQYGYDSLGKESVHTANSTQEEYVVKTRARCDYVVQQGVSRCQDWFSVKWEECMNTIQAPLINHLLCVPMQFHFLCDIMRVMTSWCTEKIPVEGNFGQTFDKLNDSINRLAEHFTTDVVLEKLEQQSVFGVGILLNFSKELSREFQEKSVIAQKIAGVIKFLLSFTFITVFTSAFVYVHQYCRDIHFDNVYITTYFRQIDARRRRAGKRYLLPLKKAEQEILINPWSLSIHPSELMPVIVGFLQVASLALFVCVLLTVDGILYNIFDLIRRHTFTTYSVTSVHHIEIIIGGDSMLARLLRKTIGAFNTSSNLDVQSSNFQCLPRPHALSQSNYLGIFIPLLLMCLMCCLQVYTNRLRRVITTFYFPKREKRRILFLYNLQIQKRISFIKRQQHRLRNQKQTFIKVLSAVLAPLKRVGCRLRWCCLCDGFVRQNQAVECSSVGCTIIYCQQCWTDLDNSCYACVPHDQCGQQDSGSESDVYYGFL